MVLVQPSAYPTQMYASATVPADAERAAEYGVVADIPRAMFQQFADMLSAADAPDPHDIAEAIEELIALPKGERPARTVVGASYGADALNEATRSGSGERRRGARARPSSDAREPAASACLIPSMPGPPATRRPGAPGIVDPLQHFVSLSKSRGISLRLWRSHAEKTPIREHNATSPPWHSSCSVESQPPRKQRREGENAVQSTENESLLADIEPFADLTTEDRRAIESFARVDIVPKGGWLYMEGDPRSCVYCLADGRIKISRLSRAGKEFILELVEPGEIFGESALFEAGAQDSFGVAVEASRVVSLPSLELRELMQSQPELLLQFAKLMDLRKKRMEGRLVTLALHKVRGRVASLLLQLCNDYGVRGRDGIRLGIRLRHQEMANLLGVSREIVSHTLSDFRREGLIESQGRKLIVRQTQPLEQI